MILKRKMYNKLLTLKKELNGKKAFLIEGARRIGKSTICEEFGKNEYKSYILIDFAKCPDEVKGYFQKHMNDLDTFFMLLSTYYGVKLFQRESLIIFDEVQMYPKARECIKYLVADGRYDYIETGSLISIKENVKNIVIPSEERHLSMYPLDFEEFLWANGINEMLIEKLKEHLIAKTPVEEALHNRYRQLLLQYVAVGGMPDVVQTFVDTKQMNTVLQMQRDIVRSYEDDMVKYANSKDKSLIKECFQSIPKQLAKENKKFQYSVIKKGSTASRFAGSLQWIEDAGIITRCYNLFATELPLEGNANEDIFKVYMVDTGLFFSMLEDGTQFDVLSGNLLGYKGAIFENLMADFFTKMGRKLYYFHKDSGLEIDFFIRYKGKCTPIEVKATQGNTKSLKTVLKNTEVYHLDSAIKLGDYNIGEENNILTLPLYMGFLLNDF